MVLNNLKLFLGKTFWSYNPSATVSTGNAVVTSTAGDRLTTFDGTFELRAGYQTGGKCVSQNEQSSYNDLIFGSSKQAVVADDYKLIDEIYEGIAISSQTANIIYADDRWTITVLKTMINRSGNVLNINEIGLKIPVCGYKAILATREILPNTLVVQPNETFTLQSQITMTI